MRKLWKLVNNLPLTVFLYTILILSLLASGALWGSNIFKGSPFAAGGVTFVGTNGDIKTDTDMTFSGSRLSVTDLTVTNAPTASGLDSAEAITLKPSGDTDDYFTFSTVADVPTLTATGASYLKYGSDIFTDRWLSQTTNTMFGIGTAGLGNLAHTAASEGYYNTFLGYNAGNAATTAYHNVFIGDEAGLVNTSGFANTFVGSAAGKANTDGKQNTFLGRDAGQANTGGDYNTFLGTDAGVANLTADYGIFIGQSAGHANETGSNNVFIGMAAGYDNVSGHDNVILGYYAGADSLSNSNVIIGSQAGFKATSAANTLVGVQAGYAVTSGAFNTLIGGMAGYTLTTNGASVMLGWQAGYYETGANKLFIDNTSRANEADGRIKSLVYGEFNATRASQVIQFNSQTNMGTSCNFKMFYQEITLDTGGATTNVGLTPNCVIISAAIRVSVQIDGLDAADHHIQLGVAGTTNKYCDAAEGAANAYISVNKKDHYTYDPTIGTEAAALILTITGGGDQTPTAGKCYVEVIYLDSSDLPNG